MLKSQLRLDSTVFLGVEAKPRPCTVLSDPGSIVPPDYAAELTQHLLHTDMVCARPRTGHCRLSQPVSYWILATF